MASTKAALFLCLSVVVVAVACARPRQGPSLARNDAAAGNGGRPAGGGDGGRGTGGAGGESQDAPDPEPASPDGPTTNDPTCGPGKHRCLADCVDNTDVKFCGIGCSACPEIKGGTATCDGTKCGVACPIGQEACRGECVPKGVAGGCADCDPGQNNCNGTCVDPKSLSTCGLRCLSCPTSPFGVATCDGDTCTLTCNPGYHKCRDACVKDTEIQNCGTSCDPCEAPEGGMATCDGTKCGSQCPAMTQLCFGKCIPAGAACMGMCPAGKHDCQGNCVSNTEVANCGTSCMPCRPQDNADATCDGTKCVFTCRPGFHLCGNECKSNMRTDSCGTSCDPCMDPVDGTPTCDGRTCDFRCDVGRKCNGRCVRDNDCRAGDGCCATGCNAANDSDCTGRCGNNVREPSETCDPCPTTCPNQGCNLQRLEGTGCNARCVSAGTQTQCQNGDGCCPGNCNSTNDNDCQARCGNNVREGNETCDPCPTSCPSSGCNLQRLDGTGCNARCVAGGTQTQCQNGDGCCPGNCNSTNDNDCQARCGNNVREGGEMCDPCPTSCPNSGCNLQRLDGTGCNARCVAAGTQTQCRGGDGCCPSGCNAANDNDCNARCGNNVREPGETCDPCPTSCPSSGCNLQQLQGSGCNAQCVSGGTQTQCRGGDGCCPSGCNANNDNNCQPNCGNRVVESGEMCDGNCPTSCSSPGGCQRNQLQGSASSCNARCVASTITSCTNGDGCCPSSCTRANDNNCAPECDASFRASCDSERTLRECRNGVITFTTCSGKCYNMKPGGGGAGCGCRPEPCKCYAPDPMFLVTDCAQDGESRQFICENGDCVNDVCPGQQVPPECQ